MQKIVDCAFNYRFSFKSYLVKENPDFSQIYEAHCLKSIPSYNRVPSTKRSCMAYLKKNFTESRRKIEDMFKNRSAPSVEKLKYIAEKFVGNE